MGKRITEEALRSDIAKVATEHGVAGRLPSNVYRTHGAYSLQAYLTRWTTWRKACEACGLKVSPKGRKTGKRKIKSVASVSGVEGGSMSNTAMLEAIRYAVIQVGYAVFGVGSTPEAAYADAANLMEGCTTERVQELCEEGRRQNGVDGAFVLVDEEDTRFASHLESHRGFELIDGQWFTK